MTITTNVPWEAKRTPETRHVEQVLHEDGFAQVDAYRYNSASIRVRVIDERFQGLSVERRDALVEPSLDKLPLDTQADIIQLFTFAPAELDSSTTALRVLLLNTEFTDPSPSTL